MFNNELDLICDSLGSATTLIIRVELSDKGC